jgi:uncharacterized protein YneF (UPF0154 family)
MKIFSKILWVVLCVGAGFMAGMMVDGSDFLYGFVQGRLYALYVLVYTGAAFMGGLWFGQRWERKWEDSHPSLQEEAELASSQRGYESSGEAAVRERSELRG